MECRLSLLFLTVMDWRSFLTALFPFLSGVTRMAYRLACFFLFPSYLLYNPRCLLFFVCLIWQKCCISCPLTPRALPHVVRFLAVEIPIPSSVRLCHFDDLTSQFDCPIVSFSFVSRERFFRSHAFVAYWLISAFFLPSSGVSLTIIHFLGVISDAVFRRSVDFLRRWQNAFASRPRTHKPTSC